MANVLILLASYNGSKYIEEMVDSIIAQDYADWHLVLSDDGSKDNTPEILEAYAAKMPEKITHYRSGMRFGNAQDHFMHLLKQFRDAPYVMFCDQDDVWHSDKIGKTLEKMKQIEANPAIPAMVHTDLRVVDGELREINPSFIAFSKLDGYRLSLNGLLMQNVVTGCTMMLNRALAELSVARTPAGGIQMHDWYIALLAAACGKTGYLDEATIDYRQHGNNVVGAKNPRLLGYILARISGKVVRGSIFAASAQAQVLLDTCSDLLPQDARTTLAAFAAVRESGWLKRKRLYVRHGFYKIGLTRCIAQFLIG